MNWDMIRPENYMLIGIGTVLVAIVLFKEVLSELGKKIARGIFKVEGRDELQRRREDELHSLLCKAVDRQFCGSHPRVVKKLDELEVLITSGDKDRKHIKRHMEWTGRCVWMVGQKLDIDMPDEPVED